MEPHRAMIIYAEVGSGEAKEAHRAEPTPCDHHSSTGRGGCHGGFGAAFPLMMVGLAAMICLLFISFGVLLCCYYKLLTTLERRPSQDLIGQQAHCNEVTKENLNTHENGPIGKEVVVIMAGKSTPTFVALPTSTQEESTQQHVLKESSVKKHAMDIPPSS